MWHVQTVDAAPLMFALFFCLLGAAMVVRGRRSRRAVPLACGIVLMVLPALAPSVVAMTIACAIVAAVPFLLSL